MALKQKQLEEAAKRKADEEDKKRKRAEAAAAATAASTAALLSSHQQIDKTASKMKGMDETDYMPSKADYVEEALQDKTIMIPMIQKTKK